MLLCSRESDQPDKTPTVGCVWCSKHLELRPLSQLAGKRGHATYSRWRWQNLHMNDNGQAITKSQTGTESMLVVRSLWGRV